MLSLDQMLNELVSAYLIEYFVWENVQAEIMVEEVFCSIAWCSGI